MRAATVYRVEHKWIGSGPYQTVPHENDVAEWEWDEWFNQNYTVEDIDSIVSALIETHSGCTDHPTPHADGALRESTHLIGNGWVCCVETLEGLRDWFYGFEDDLIQAGYRFYELVVDLDYDDEEAYIDPDGRVVVHGDYQSLVYQDAIITKTELTLTQEVSC